jgi:hypothetical protein
MMVQNSSNDPILLAGVLEEMNKLVVNCVSSSPLYIEDLVQPSDVRGDGDDSKRVCNSRCDEFARELAMMPMLPGITMRRMTIGRTEDTQQSQAKTITASIPDRVCVFNS